MKNSYLLLETSVGINNTVCRPTGILLFYRSKGGIKPVSSGAPKPKLPSNTATGQKVSMPNDPNPIIPISPVNSIQKPATGGDIQSENFYYKKNQKNLEQKVNHLIQQLQWKKN